METKVARRTGLPVQTGEVYTRVMSHTEIAAMREAVDGFMEDLRKIDPKRLREVRERPIHGKLASALLDATFGPAPTTNAPTLRSQMSLNLE